MGPFGVSVLENKVFQVELNPCHLGEPFGLAHRLDDLACTRPHLAAF